jgi:hypothetical protein
MLWLFQIRRTGKFRSHPHFLTKHLKKSRDFMSASSFYFRCDTFEGVAYSYLLGMPHIRIRKQSAYQGTCLYGLCGCGAAGLENQLRPCGISRTRSTCESPNAAYQGSGPFYCLWLCLMDSLPELILVHPEARAMWTFEMRQAS